jgi:hypothetical protein
MLGFLGFVLLIIVLRPLVVGPKAAVKSPRAESTSKGRQVSRAIRVGH